MPSRRWQDYPRVRIDLPSEGNLSILIQPHLRSAAISHLQELCEKTGSNAVVVFIYCNYKAQYSVLRLFEALLKQLTFRRLTFNSAELLKGRQKQGHRPSLGAFTTMLKGEVETYSKAFIVVDAPDECSPEQAQRDLLGLLRSSPIVAPAAKLMVTSRYIPSIKRAIHADVQLKTVATESDIGSHVEV